MERNFFRELVRMRQEEEMAGKKIEVECPYCGHKNTVLIDIQGGGFVASGMHTCDLEDGGCDIPFVVTATVSVNAQAVRIDWSEDDYPHINRDEVTHSDIVGAEYLA